MSPKDTLVNEDGTIDKSWSPEAIQKHLEKMLLEGDIIAAIMRLPNGDVGVHVYGPPSIELLNILDLTVANYRRAVMRMALAPKAKES